MASAPAGNRSCPVASFAARHTPSATSASVVTAVWPPSDAKMRCANGAYGSGMSPSRRGPVLLAKRVLGPYPGSTTVTTANGGISALVRTLAVELSPIRVNALHPSIVSDTPFWSDKPAAREAAATRALTRRPVTMRDCTEAIDFLLTNRAINGINLNIDGGDVLI